MSNKMTSYKLAEAIDILAFLNEGKQVTAIQFEDGSGYKFNYQLGSGPWQFIDFATTNLTAYYYNRTVAGSDIIVHE